MVLIEHETTCEHGGAGHFAVGVMYIGPWQEYRLAKIQDDAIQRLRQEWEAQLRGQLPSGEDDRIRELMQPLMAKLPAMLLNAKSRTSGSSAGVKNGRLVGSRSGIQSEGTSRSSSRPASARSTASSTRSTCGGVKKSGDGGQRHTMPGGASNQDTHDVAAARAPLKPQKPKKKGKKAPLTALEQVQKRKKMFATWIKQAGNGGGGSSDASAKEVSATVRESKLETNAVADAGNVTRLPLIHSSVPASAAMLLGEDPRPKASRPLTLPPLCKLNVLSNSLPPAESPARAAVMSPRLSAPSDSADVDLDESVDEEELNNLLNWTDTLLSPQALDSLCDFDA